MVLIGNRPIFVEKNVDITSDSIFNPQFIYSQQQQQQNVRSEIFHAVNNIQYEVCYVHRNNLDEIAFTSLLLERKHFIVYKPKYHWCWIELWNCGQQILWFHILCGSIFWSLENNQKKYRFDSVRFGSMWLSYDANSRPKQNKEKQFFL